MKQLLIIMSNDVQMYYIYILIPTKDGPWKLKKAYFQWGPYGINNNKY